MKLNRQFDADVRMIEHLKLVIVSYSTESWTKGSLHFFHIDSGVCHIFMLKP